MQACTIRSNDRVNNELTVDQSFLRVDAVPLLHFALSDVMTGFAPPTVDVASGSAALSCPSTTAYRSDMKRQAFDSR